MPKPKVPPPILDASKLTLDEWLKAIRSRDFGLKYDVADYCFPTERHREEYLGSVATRPEVEVRDLVRSFLVPAGWLGSDSLSLKWFLQQANARELFDTVEFYRRLAS